MTAYEWRRNQWGWNKYAIFPNGNEVQVNSSYPNLPFRWAIHYMGAHRMGVVMRYW